MLHRSLQQHLHVEARLRLHIRLPPRKRRRSRHPGTGSSGPVPELRRTRQPPPHTTHGADRQRAARIRGGAGQELPQDGRRRDRALPQGEDGAHRRRSGGGEDHRPGPPPGGDEHGRQGGPSRKRHPLCCVGLHAHRGLGRQHRDTRPGSAGLRDSASVRAGSRPRTTPPVLPAQRLRPVRRRVRRRARHTIRLHGESGRAKGSAAPRDGACQGGPARPGPSRNPVPESLRLPHRSTQGGARRRIH